MQEDGNGKAHQMRTSAEVARECYADATACTKVALAIGSKERGMLLVWWVVRPEWMFETIAVANA